MWDIDVGYSHRGFSGSKSSNLRVPGMPAQDCHYHQA